ncbi:MAG: CPBP family intramembrane metalloprotease [Bacteroidaceae bacterium]|nr:CPBP family intramembrane metalloprotease [Bacteroidaceae bacterium]
MNYKPLLAILIFLLLQAIGGILLAAIHPITPTALSLTVILTGLLSVLIIHRMGLIRFRRLFSTRHISWPLVPVALIGALTGSFASEMLCELLNLPDLMADQFMDLAESPWGILSVALIAPVIEETVFREAVLGHMLRQGIRPLTAIPCSALAFGLVHGNPVQILFATLIGCILGIIYYKTGSILVTTLYHIINNTAAVIQMNLLGDQSKDIRYADLLGTTGLPLTALLLSIVCILLMKHFWDKTPAAPFCQVEMKE